MKEFGIGILKLVAGSIVFIPMIFGGFIYAVMHAIYMTVTLKNYKALGFLVWRWFDGMLASIGHILGEIAYGLDLLSNVNGEIYEDALNLPEDSSFGVKKISVSSSTGEQVHKGNYPEESNWFLKWLNFGFKQKQHALDSYLYDTEKAEIRKKYFK